MDFFTQASAAQLLEPGFDFVVDATDKLSNKCLIITGSRERNIPVLTVGGGRWQARRHGGAGDDLAFSVQDELLRQVRRKLRRDCGFSREQSAPFAWRACIRLRSRSFRGRTAHAPPNRSRAAACGWIARAALALPHISRRHLDWPPLGKWWGGLRTDVFLPAEGRGMSQLPAEPIMRIIDFCQDNAGRLRVECVRLVAAVVWRGAPPGLHEPSSLEVRASQAVRPARLRRSPQRRQVARTP